MFVKMCGITSVVDALAAAEAGADAIGLNFIPSSRRRVLPEQAREIAQALPNHIEIIAVVADLNPAQIDALRALCRIDRWQLAGREGPAEVRALLPHAFKMVRISGPEDVGEAERYPGELILVDAKVPGELGGTGQSFDWRLVSSFALRRRLLLAGGLTPENVTAAIATVHPWGVDVATGIEAAPGLAAKDSEKMQRFVRAARSA